jgi:HAD superfamily hydrolase (TIGR01509 family)
MKTRQGFGSFDDKPVRKGHFTPSCLFRLRNGIRLRPLRHLLVCRRERQAADAGRRRRLPVPGLSAQGGGASRERNDTVTDRWNIDAVLLDMDGTLLDTEKVYLESLIAALGACGYTDDILSLGHSMVGIPAAECEAMLLDRYGAHFPLADLNAAFVTRRDEIFRAGIPLKRGAMELLDALHDHGYPMAIVTSSSRRTAEEHLTLAGIRDRFDAVLTRDDVARGKPSPDLYLLGARQLGFPPASCLAIEDSNPGVAAAHAAGAVTIMVPDIVPPTEASHTRCAAVLPDLGAVVEMLRDRGELRRALSLRAP